METPTRLGRYSLLKKLATGSALETYLARRTSDPEPGGEVVVRKLRPRVAESADAVALFQSEVERARGLDHPNLGRALEFVSAPSGEQAIVVEFVWGEDLRRIAERGMTVGRFMPVELAVRVALEITEALSFLHERRDAAGQPQQLVHGHVAPSNVLVGFDGSVKLVDFGIARAEEQLAESLKGRRRQLKYAYMSPEQVEGGHLDHRSDLFSLGTLLYEYTTRKRLFKGSDDVSTMKLVAEADVRAPSESIPSYPPALERIVLKALSREPGERYQSALELRDDLRAFLAESGLEADTDELAEYMTGIFPDRIKEYEKLLGEGYSGPRESVANEIEAELAAAPAAPAAPRKAEPAAPAAPAVPPPPPPLVTSSGGKKGAGLPEIKLPPLPGLKAKPPIPDKAEVEKPAEPEAAPPPPPVPPPSAPGAESRSEMPSVAPGAIDRAALDEEDEEEVVHPPDAAAFPLPAGVEGFRQTAEERPAGESGPAPVVPIPEFLKRKESDSQVITAVHTLRKDMPDAFEEAAERSRTVVKAVAFAMILAIGFVVWYGTTYHWPWEDIEPVPDRPDVEPLPPPTPPDTMGAEVTSVPPGAAVSVNGVIADAPTPTTVQVVPDAPNTLVFFMDGYATRVLDVPIGNSLPAAPLSVDLVALVQPPDWEPPPPDPDSDMPPITEWAPPVGRINVQTDPEGATVLLDGRDVCRSPCEFGVIAGQEQHITARLPGYLDTVAFTWAYPWDAENDTRFLTMTLREPPPTGQQYSYLELNSTPEGARVRIDGESAGRTQLNAPLRIEDFHRVELEAPDYHPWTRSFYPTPGRFEVSPVMARIVTEPSQLSLLIDTPGLEETKIYLGPNELGTGSLDAYEIGSGTYELTLSYTPPPDSGAQRRRSVIEVTLPPGEHTTEHYAWDGETYALVSRTTGPLVERPDE